MVELSISAAREVLGEQAERTRDLDYTVRQAQDALAEARALTPKKANR